MDSLIPGFPPGADYLITRHGRRWVSWSAARARDAQACHQGHSAWRTPRQPPGSLCTFRRCTAGLAQGCRGFTRQAWGSRSRTVPL